MAQPRISTMAAALGLAVLVGAISVAGTLAYTIGSKSGRSVTAVKTVTSDAGASTQSETAVDLPGMSLTLTVAAGERALLVVTFSGDSACVGSSLLYPCRIRALVDGSVIAPGIVSWSRPSVADQYVADTHSMQWVTQVSAGSHVVKIQYYVTTYGAFNIINARTLTVLRSKV